MLCVPLLAVQQEKRSRCRKTLLARTRCQFLRPQAVRRERGFSGKQWHTTTCQKFWPHTLPAELTSLQSPGDREDSANSVVCRGRLRLGGTSLSAAKGVAALSTTPFVPQGVPPKFTNLFFNRP